MMISVQEIFEDITNKKMKTCLENDEGFSNDVFLINNKFYLRIANQYKDPGVNYHLEHQIIDILKNNSLSEEVVFHDEKDGTKISKKLPKMHTSKKFNDRQITKLADYLKKLHNIDASNLDDYKFAYKLKNYKFGLSDEDLLDEDEENKIIAQFDEVSKKYKNVLCHNDIVQNNILFSRESIELIDWEFASSNFEIFDIASFLSENSLSKRQRNLFLHSYYGENISDELIKDINITEKAQDILFYYWAIHMYYYRQEKGYLKIAISKQEKLEELI